MALKFIFVSLIALAAFSAGNAAAANPPLVVLVSGEYEYKSQVTLPAFKRYLETNYPVTCLYLERSTNDLPGIDVLAQADLAIFMIRRMTLPEPQLAAVRRYLAAGKPLIGLRTTSHAFENWKEFDATVLGGNYHNHFGNTLQPAITIAAAAASHPILKQVPERFASPGSLYKNQPIVPGATVLLEGEIPGQPREPVAWTHRYRNARIFYTSLGHPDDFENPAFRQLLVNAVFWALDRPVPAKTTRGPQKVNLAEFEKLRRDTNHVVLDVRTAREFNAGHIPGAINIDVTAPGFADQVKRLDKDKAYLVLCARGGRSARACEQLSQLNFPVLYDLEEGFVGWEKAGKPTAKTEN